MIGILDCIKIIVILAIAAPDLAQGKTSSYPEMGKITFGISSGELKGMKLCTLTPIEDFNGYGFWTAQFRCSNFTLAGSNYQLGYFTFSNDKLTNITLILETSSRSIQTKIRNKWTRKYGRPTKIYTLANEGDPQTASAFLDGRITLRTSALRTDLDFDATKDYPLQPKGDKTTNSGGCPARDQVLNNLEQQCRGMVEYGAISGSGNKVDSTQFCACLTSKVDNDGKIDACGIGKLSHNDLYRLTSDRQIVASCGPAPH